MSDFLAAYITLPIFLVLYFGHKIYFAIYQVIKGESWDGSPKTGSKMQQFFGSFVFFTKVQDIDVVTGKREMDALEEMDVPPVPKNWLQKFWFWLA